MAYKRKWVTRKEAAKIIGCDPQTVSNYIAEGTLTGRKSGKGITMVATATIGDAVERFKTTRTMGRVKKPDNPHTKLALVVQWNDGECIMNHDICIPQYYVTPLRETEDDSVEDIKVALEDAEKFDNVEILVFTDPKEYEATARMYRRFSAIFIPKKDLFKE
jgi:hypothetical protein